MQVYGVMTVAGVRGEEAEDRGRRRKLIRRGDPEGKSRKEKNKIKVRSKKDCIPMASWPVMDEKAAK